MRTSQLQNVYSATNQKTLSIWRETPGIGEIRTERYYDPDKLALATGIRPQVPAPVAGLIRELAALVQRDRLADMLPLSSVHFTFLPLTLPLYEENEPLPAKTRQLEDIWREYQGKHIVIRHLRLVALPGQLLLAGIPDDPAIAMRQSFCESVLKSQWKEELLQRHAGSPLPAPFWHSTILRYNAQFLPEALRDFFARHQAVDFGEVSGELVLARVNYNWTTCLINRFE
ncbi:MULTISPECIES: hypothetical protein [Lelliottia]|uniref:Uncharacterized protein n=1 Tax=Lelliottia wanjuensis TaxID=3050585 RepID=A0AAP4D5F1_9ENTR|nr:MULTISPECIES: hypothetical protein [unclassified Lelliottia]MDK9364500.1 hypothetical protein [Lelliottia sp. V106_12]MDK9583047.1 hypothetical protein [Lelliottia sp. V86_10]MDK9618263.1 hypothetical protein [Lelliottia sp. V106_9]